MATEFVICSVPHDPGIRVHSVDDAERVMDSEMLFNVTWEGEVHGVICDLVAKHMAREEVLALIGGELER